MMHLQFVWYWFHLWLLWACYLCPLLERNYESSVSIYPFDCTAYRCGASVLYFCGVRFLHMHAHFFNDYELYNSWQRMHCFISGSLMLSLHLCSLLYFFLYSVWCMMRLWCILHFVPVNINLVMHQANMDLYNMIIKSHWPWKHLILSYAW